MFGRFGLIGNIASIFGTEQEIAVPLQKKKSFQERLDDIGFPHEAIPEEFCCKLSYEIMDNPMILDNDRDHDHIVDKAFLDQLWVDVTVPANRINPFTQSRIRLEPQLDIRLQQEIEKFISEKEQIITHTNLRIARIKKKVHLDSLPRSNAERALSLQITTDDLPSHFIDNLLTGKIMTYPVMLDGHSDHVVDLIALLDWWEEDKANKNKNPYTCDFLRSIDLIASLHDQIEAYLSDIESDTNTLSNEHLQQQITLVMTFVQYYHHDKTNHQRLIDAGFSENKLTKQQRKLFIAQNFVDEIMTHPVKLDGKDVIDFIELNNWWLQDKKNQFKNHYTGKRLKSIEYDDKLKDMLEEYITDLSNQRDHHKKSTLSSWVPISQNLRSKHALFKHPQHEVKAGLLSVINQHQDETNPRSLHAYHNTIRE